MSTLFDLPFEEPDPPAAAPGPSAPRARRILSVSELTARVRTLLEERFVELWVEGELSNCRVWNTGHLYFTLKDGGAQIRGVMFRNALRLLRFTPKDGLGVVARGRISVYDPKGEYQLVCEHLEPAGLGALQLAFEQLKARLAAEGLFDPRRKRPLPVLPRKIGIVTSLDGAALRDIIKVLRRRHANAHIVVRPTRVQGEGAAIEVARAVTALGRHPGIDVVIVGRGGGSIEDLWAFNEEVVARAMAGCPVPTIAAVGHETDVTIADFVADLRAPTPSAAAEMVVARKDDVCTRIERLSDRVDAAMRGRLHRLEARVRTLEARPGYAGAHGRLLLRGRHVADLTHALRRQLQAALAGRERRCRQLRLTLDTFDLRRRLGRIRARLASAEGRLTRAISERRHGTKATLAAAEGRLRTAMLARRHGHDAHWRAMAARLGSLSPLAVLGRGYAVCWTADGATILRDAARVATGDQVRITLARGELACDVRDVTTDTRGADDV